MKEIRDIKIDMLMGNENPIMYLFNEITDGIKIMNCNVYNEDGLEFIYYNKNNEWIFYQDIKNKRFWCEYIRYWSNFQTKLNLGYEEIQVITKLLVEDALKRELDTPGTILWTTSGTVEDALKRELDTPLQKHYKLLPQLEEVLKRELDTPQARKYGGTALVEEVLKREIDAKPITSRSYKVEDTLKREIKKKSYDNNNSNSGLPS